MVRYSYYRLFNGRFYVGRSIFKKPLFRYLHDTVISIEFLFKILPNYFKQRQIIFHRKSTLNLSCFIQINLGDIGFLASVRRYAFLRQMRQGVESKKCKRTFSFVVPTNEQNTTWQHFYGFKCYY